MQMGIGEMLFVVLLGIGTVFVGHSLCGADTV